MKNNNTKNITIDEDLFKSEFPDAHFDYHGYFVTSTPIQKLIYFDDENTNTLLNALPNEITNDKSNILIKSKNICDFFENEMLDSDELIQAVENYDKSFVEYETYGNDEPLFIKNDNLMKFIHDELTKSSNLQINNNDIIVLKNDELADTLINLIESYKNKQ